MNQFTVIEIPRTYDPAIAEERCDRWCVIALPVDNGSMILGWLALLVDSPGEFLRDEDVSIKCIDGRHRDTARVMTTAN